jgi:GT2 family glycosyltransferase
MTGTPTTFSGSRTQPTCSVIICAYTDKRWELLCKGYLASVAQLHPGDEIIVVIDHNRDLYARASAEFTSATVIENAGPTGLSGGRNTGVAAAKGDVVVFLDDDAWPAEHWLDSYRSAFATADVAVVAGSVDPEWDGGAKPAWFPEEFGWVVGCDYRGLPGDQQPIRNPIGANMAIRRDVVGAVGGFSTDVGRVGTTPAGCEETDLSIRITQAKPDLRKIRVTPARVSHLVPAGRQTWRYFVSRCFHEGRSKKILAARVGTDDGLGSERTYVTHTLTSGFARELLAPFSGKLAGPARSAAIATGLVATATGYLSVRAATTAGPAEQDESETDAAETGLGTGDGTPSGWRPLRVVEYDLDSGAVTDGRTVDVALAADDSARIRLLVLSGGQPLNFLDLTDGEDIPSADEVARRLDLPSGDGRPNADGRPVSAAERFANDPDAPLVSVVIATRGRTAELPGCVDSLLAQLYPNYEVIIVDNNDDPTRLPALLAAQLMDPRVRIVHEAQRGVSVARNNGTRVARGVLIAATDDDVVAAPTWLPELVAAFDDPTVDCVTGLVVPDGYRTPAQELFEEFGGFSKGFVPARFDLVDHRAPEPLYPYSAGVYGSGNNVAFRKAALDEIGGYDCRLGPGTLVKSGEDLDLFLKFLFAGKTLVYRPSAWVRHSHRRSMEELHTQIQNYGRGLSAVILKWALSDPRRLAEILRRLPAGLRRLLDGGSDRNAGRTASYPASLSRAELRGLLEGSVLLPIQAARTRWGRRRH